MKYNLEIVNPLEIYQHNEWLSNFGMSKKRLSLIFYIYQVGENWGKGGQEIFIDLKEVGESFNCSKKFIETGLFFLENLKSIEVIEKTKKDYVIKWTGKWLPPASIRLSEGITHGSQIPQEVWDKLEEERLKQPLQDIPEFIERTPYNIKITSL